MGDKSKKNKEKERKKGEKRDAPGSTGETPEHKKPNTLDVSTQSLDCSLDSMDVSLLAGQGMSEDPLQKIQHALFLLKNDLGSKIDNVCGSVEFLSQSLRELQEEVRSMRTDIGAIKHLEDQVQSLKIQNKALNQRLNDLENYSRRDNIVISGLKEESNENCKDLFKLMVREKLQIHERIEVVRVHRLGKADHGQRPLIARLRYYDDKELIMSKTGMLKGSGIYFNDDLCPESNRNRSSLVPVWKELKKVDNRTRLQGDKIKYKGQLFGINDVHKLPIEAHIACTESKNGITLFSGRFSRLSNLHPCKLVINGKEWPSVEHVYQHEKAIFAGRPEIAALITSSENPVEAMSIGKAIRLDTPDWNERANQVMTQALEVKFAIPQFKLALQSTKDIIGEATTNKYWGIGLTRGHSDAFLRDKWKGGNHLGELLMDLKSQLCPK